MEISYNWLQEYLSVEDAGKKAVLDAETIGEILTETGLELESISTYESVPGSLNGLVIGEILSVEKHPNADKLSLTKVDAGNGGPLSIICGAPNVATGQKVIVAPVNTTIYPISGEPFTIKKAKIRGVESQGMICAEDEIGLGTGHDGIIVLPDSANVGQKASDFYQIQTDSIFDIALTPNRSDAHSHIGVARDLSAYLKVNTEYDVSLNMPNPDLPKNAGEKLAIDVKVIDREACPRYSGIVIKDLKIAASPDWLQDRLKSIGVKPINNVVDITNFVLHEMGQPLHAFDYDKIGEKKIRVQTLPTNTEFITLDSETKKLDAGDLMICDGSKGMCIAGVYGGLDSGVSGSTETIFLESAYFDPVSIRKSALRHNLRTDAAMRFEKGIDPDLTVKALARAYEMLSKYAGGKLASDLIDIKNREIKEHEISLDLQYVNRLTGHVIDPEKVQVIFESLGISVISKNGHQWQLDVPTYKTDVTRPADLVEELLRIYGFNRIPFADHFRPTIADHPTGNSHEIKGKVADYLTSIGFSENSSLSFSHSELLKKADNERGKDWAMPENPISSEMDVMRPEMLGSALQNIAFNHNRSNTDLKLFEFGRTYHKNGGEYSEKHHLTLSFTGLNSPESWENEKRETGFFDLKTAVQNILRTLGLGNAAFEELTEPPFQFGQKLKLNQKTAAYFGKILPETCKVYGVKKQVWFADFDWKYIEKCANRASVVFKEIPKFPSIRRDLALITDRSVPYTKIEGIARKIGGKLLNDVHLFDIYEDKKLGDQKISYAISFVFQDSEKTLTDKNIDKIMSKMIKEFEHILNITLR